MRIVTLVAAAVMTVGFATPALATDQVDCSVAGSVKIHWTDNSGTPRTNCYSNVGQLEVSLPRTSSVEAGNNFGWVDRTGPGGAGERLAFGPGQTVQVGGFTIVSVRIT
ncbi:hypothetical protein [Lentzea sp. NPDC051838]|uniref:hypothetical protein n=1 Tax=Lentzea sp. NPDC051838 TaxID=3154849 RepID=UPI00343519DF